MNANYLPLEKFSLNDPFLPGFFSEVAIDLDNYAQGKTGELVERDCQRVTLASEMLRDVSRNLRGPVQYWIYANMEFFWDFFGREDVSIENSGRSSMKELTDLSEKLAIFRELPREKVGELGIICSNLSKKLGDCWTIANPDGFKKYSR